MKNPKRKEGAALVESSLVMIMLCLILFGILQVCYLIAARDVVSYTALATARSATIGYNGFMVNKVVHAISIPTAGPVITPKIRSFSPGGRTGGQKWNNAVRREPRLDQFYAEDEAIGDYLMEEQVENLDSILNYDNWRDYDSRIALTELNYETGSAPGGDTVEITVRQYVPMVFPFARAYYGANIVDIFRQDSGAELNVPSMRISQSVKLENHSALYLESSP